MTRLPLTTRCLGCGEEGDIFVACDCREREYEAFKMKIMGQYHELLAKMAAHNAPDTAEKRKFNFIRWFKGLL